MSDSLRWPDAVLAGLASSMRSSAAPAGLAVHGHITGKPRIAVLAAAVGELAADKSPSAPSRTDRPAILGRVAAGTYAGRKIAGPPGAAAGAVSAAAGSYATWRIRGLVVATTGLPDPVVAVGEDVLALSLAVIAARPDPESSEMSEPVDPFAPPPLPPLPNGTLAGAGSQDESPQSPQSLARDAGIGLIVGLGATAAMTIVQGAEFVLTDAEPSSSPAEAADRLKRRAGRGKLARKHRRAANQGMHWLYGVSWGIPYGIVAARSDVAPEVSGPVFGLLVWGAALAHEPALGLADVPWKRSLQSLGSEALFHLVYGIGAGGTLRWLQGRRRGRRPE
jgi:uncharacterized membrane protein